jgi:hypothetical protein
MPMSVMFAVALASTPHDRANHRFGILSFDLLARGRVSTLNFGRH